MPQSPARSATSFVIQNGSDPALHNQFIHLNFASNHGDVYHNDFDAIRSAVTQLDPNDPNRDVPSEFSIRSSFCLIASRPQKKPPFGERLPLGLRTSSPGDFSV